ncbi:MAG TPA: hypothetical protein PKD72_08600, partial [Gemmatales bacterium]|nr:hypothetical protein [Gemmatales bacterium]
MESQAAGDARPITKPMRQDKKNDPNQPWRLALSSSDIPVDGFVFWFRANDGITRKFKLAVVSRTPPSVSDLEVKLTYPAYTRRRETVQGMGPIQAIVGTQVDLLVTADRPAALGELEVFMEEAVTEAATGETKTIEQRLQNIRLIRPESSAEDNQLVLQEPLQLTSSFIAREDRKQSFFYRLTLVSPENLTGTSPKYPLQVQPDLPPRVKILRVKETEIREDLQEIEVESNAVLPITGLAYDDIAMDQVRLKLNTTDGRELFYVGQAPVEK